MNSDGSALLNSEKILCLKAFDAAESGTSVVNSDFEDEDRQNGGSNRWSNSNIREWLNSDSKTVDYSTQPPTNSAVWKGYNDYANEAGFLTNFNANEKAAIKAVTHKSLLDEVDSGYKDGGAEEHEYNYDISEVVTNYDSSYYENVTDKVFFLDVKELHDYVHARGWECRKKPTEIAILKSEYTFCLLHNGQC